MRELTFPGFIDVHVHFRDPGMPKAETISSGLAAAKKGGFAAVVTMPNTSPACDSKDVVIYQKDRVAAAHLNLVDPPLLIPSAAITKGRLGQEVGDLELLANEGVAFFTDDGSYVADAHVMEAAMRRVAALGMCVCQHAMNPKVQAGGVMRCCSLARRYALPTLPPATETTAIRRDLALCRMTGCRLHIQHISTAKGVELVREAQREGLPVTAEATPHHLLLSCEDIQEDDANYKMAPPLGNHEDRAELRRAVKDGVLMFATDHAPHPEISKARGFRSSANGIVGLETAIPITYAVMVEEEGMGVESWARAWWDLPRRIIGSNATNDRLLEGLGTTTVVVDRPRRVDVNRFVSLSRNCPYDGLAFTCWSKEV